MSDPRPSVLGAFLGVEGGNVVSVLSVDSAPGFSARGSGAGSEQGSRPTGFFRTHEIAAIEWFNFIYPKSAATEWEWGGHICTASQMFAWSRPVTSQIQDQVFTDALTTCAPFGQKAAHIHTHPPAEFGSPPNGGDFENADTNLVPNYQMTTMPATGVRRQYRYWKSPTRLSENNLCERTAAGDWVPVVPGAQCLPPN
jgi:hypothetical protein